MANGKKPGFLLRHEWAALLEGMSSDREFRQLVMAILNYSETGNEVQDLSGEARLLFSFFKKRVSEDAERYNELCKSRQEAGRKGGRKKTKSNQLVSNETKQKQINPSSSSIKEGAFATEDDDNSLSSFFSDEEWGLVKEWEQRFECELGEEDFKDKDLVKKIERMFWATEQNWFSIKSTPRDCLRSMKKDFGEMKEDVSASSFSEEYLSILTN